MTANAAIPVLRAAGLGKSYPGRQGEPGSLVLFRDLHLVVHASEMVAITGRSGAGKSSLLYLLAGLEAPNVGEVWLGNDALHTLSPEQLAAIRNRRIGYVWQFHYLLPEFTAAENVALPLLAGQTPHREALATAARWLERVGLAQRAQHRAGELSGGEQQRVAIARALAVKPEVLLADEPTGDLDDSTAAELFSLLQSLCREEQLAAVLVTHNEELAAQCDRRLQLVEGRLEPVAT